MDFLIYVVALVALYLLYLLLQKYVKNVHVSKLIQFAELAARAVEQTHKDKPDNISQSDWNKIRLTDATQFVLDLADKAGIKVTKEEIDVIKGLIEAAVYYLPKPLLGLVSSASIGSDKDNS